MHLDAGGVGARFALSSAGILWQASRGRQVLQVIPYVPTAAPQGMLQQQGVYFMVPAIAWVLFLAAASQSAVDASPKGQEFPVADASGAYAPPPASARKGPSTPNLQKGAVAAWQPLGPFGGDVSAVASSPTSPGLVLAGTAPPNSGGSLYRSTDGGLSWTQLSVNVGGAVYDIEFAADGNVFVGASNGVIYGSGNATQFVARDLGIGLNQVVRDVHLVAGSSTRLWVAIANGFGQQPVGLMRSDDGGVTWVNRTPPLGSGLGGAAVAVDPADPDRILAAFNRDFGGGGVHASSDGGLTWADRSAGLPPDRPVNSIVHDGARFLIGGGQLFANQFVGLYATTNLGAQWTALHDATWPTLAVTEIAIDPNRPATILAACSNGGVHRSTNGGITWEIGVGGTSTLAVSAVRFAAGSSTNVLLGADATGVYRSVNGGTDFVPSSRGILGVDTTAVASNPLDALDLAISFSGLNSGGVFRSTDGGLTWQAQRVPPTRYADVAFGPDGTLYALSSGPSSIAPEGLYRRQPNGDWIGLGPDQGPFYETDLRVIAFDAQQPAAIFFGGSDFGNVVGNESTIWRFNMAGAGWTKVFEGENLDEITDLQFVGGNTALAAYDALGGMHPAGVLRSTNGGANWSPANTGFGAGLRSPTMCRTPAGTWWLTAFVGFSVSHVYRSDDVGAGWQQTGAPVGSLIDIACDPASSQSIYFGLASAPWVARTLDNAFSFESWGRGIGGNGSSRDMLPAGGRILMATASGLYRSPPLDLVFGDEFEPN